ncbi:hypothetical protein IFR23_06380 [Sphingomonas sp. CFBP 13603]|uniref:hypothetical protein n=1 Tax=Sphingomonas sp. CFBP 13603 TaxID=2774040 RepID=UPI0018682CA5|nr:hypothetical protein [Sphingomonas sp. CFBP 13603]MBE2991641.1 hypothetical protein [Sphingomonas sp. CFBP 13603]
MADVTMGEMFDTAQRWRDDIALLDRAIANTSGLERKALRQVRGGLQKVRSKLVAGLNGYPGTDQKIDLLDQGCD